MSFNAIADSASSLPSSIILPNPAPTPLGIYRVLSPNAGIRVSPLQLGGMSIGDQWAGAGMGEMNKESSFKLLDAFYEAGGNIIDTSNGYQGESSERFIGEWMETRGVREQMVIATKYTGSLKMFQNPQPHIGTNYAGNNAKSLRVSVDNSLKKLRTDYIDILYVHWWDFRTSIREVMDHLHTLVLQGKVLYLGISDTPAWVVATANEYAKMANKTPFCIYQGAWNVLDRSFEREIIPMARELGLALAPWNVLATGRIRTDEEEKAREETGEKGRMLFLTEWKRNEEERSMVKALEKVAAEVGAKSIRSVAIAYLMQKTTHVFPIIGGRKVEHMKENIESLTISLSDEQMQYIESVKPFDPGFPHAMIGDGAKINGPAADIAMGSEAKWPLREPIKPKVL